MIVLRQLLPEYPLPAAVAATPVPALRLDSRRVQAGDMFLAVPGHQTDGRRFIAAAIAAGAGLVVQQGDAFRVDRRDGVACITVPGLCREVGNIAARFFGQPGSALRLVGVTGTNGKTSITWFLRDALDALGHCCGLIGTVEVGLKGLGQASGQTTPDPISLQDDLHVLRARGADCVALEVSSHALDQHRLADTPVEVAVFSNLSRDHLDYHGDMDAYLAAKARLFSRVGLRSAVINRDDPASTVLLAGLDKEVDRTIFGAAGEATVHGLEYRPHAHGMDVVLSVDGQRVTASVPLFGAFNRDNLMAVAGVLHALGYEGEQIDRGLAAVTPVPGRMEPVRESGKPVVLVDYAHTPDGLEKALAAARDHFSGRLYCVVGCGGERDRGKRPMMAAAAERLADDLVLTSDNPRHEDPAAIVDQMMAGLSRPARARRIIERPAAIEWAVAEADRGDVILVAGKGHETWQEIAGGRYPMDDRVLARTALAAWGGAA